MRCLPAGVTDIITGSPRIPDTVTVSSPRTAGRPKTGRENRGQHHHRDDGFPGLFGTQIRPEHQPRSTSRGGIKPKRGALRSSVLASTDHGERAPRLAVVDQPGEGNFTIFGLRGGAGVVLSAAHGPFVGAAHQAPTGGFEGRVTTTVAGHEVVGSGCRRAPGTPTCGAGLFPGETGLFGGVSRCVVTSIAVRISVLTSLFLLLELLE